jgi:hypothetical protein
MLSTFLIASTGLSLVYDDVLNTLTITCTVTQYTDEMARDALGLALTAGTGIAIVVNDAGDTITISSTVTQYTDEMAQDAIAALIAAGTSPGLAIVYNDAGNAIGFTVNVAADTDIWGGTNDTKFITPKRLKDWRTPVSVADAATITLDGTTGVNFYVTLGGNRILANPTNFNPGQFGVIHVTQDGTGTRTLTFGSNWKFGSTSIAGNVLSVAAGSTDAIHYYVRADGTITSFIIQSLTGSPARLKLDDLSNVNMTTPPTNGQVLTYDTATSKWKPAAGGGGSSTPWYWLPPTAATFTLSNGGGAANMVLTDDTDVGLILEPTTFAAASALSHCFALQALASSTADWTLEIKFEGDVNGQFEYNGFGICLYETSTNKFIFFGNRTFGSYRSTMVDYWASASSFNSDQRTMQGSPYKFLRVVHTGGNYKFYISAAGKRFFQILSVGDTAFLAGRADKVGFAMGSARNTDIHWQFAVQRYSLT